METLETLYNQLKRFIELKAYVYSNGDQFVNEELNQVGYIAINTAINTYKQESKATLKSFAMRTIEWEMKDYLSKNLRHIRLPGNVVYKKDFEFKQPISADLIVNEDDGTRIVDNLTESPENGLNLEYLHNVLSKLSEDEQKLIKLRFVEEMKLSDIGNEFGVTKEMIRLRLNKVLAKLSKLIDIEELY